MQYNDRNRRKLFKNRRLYPTFSLSPPALITWTLWLEATLNGSSMIAETQGMNTKNVY